MLYDIRISETIFVQDTKKNNNKKSICENDPNAFLLWAQQDLNLWPPDYESGATNQLSYGPYLQMEKYSLPLQNLMQK